MKRIWALVGSMIAATPALGVVIAYDGFVGPAGDLNGCNGGSGWSGPWMDFGSSQITACVLPGLSVPGLVTMAGAAVTPPGMLTFDAANYTRTLQPFPGVPHSVYVSFILRGDAGYGSYAGIQLGAYPGGSLQVGVPMGMYEYGMRLGRYGFALSGIPMVPGRSVLLVLEILKTSPATTYNLYVSPSVSQPKPAFPNLTVGAVGYPMVFNEIMISNDGGYTIDEMRVTTEWEEAIRRPHCVADVDDGTMTGTLDGGVTVDDLIYYLYTFDQGSVFADVDDGSSTGTLDGGVTIDDLLYFLVRFDLGC